LNGRVDPTGGTYPDISKYPDDGFPRVTDPGISSSPYEKNTSHRILTVHVYAPIDGTEWEFTSGCPY